MDNETFATLVEVLAFECKNDPSKYEKFAGVFFGEYNNKSISFLHMDTLYANHGIVVMSRGKPTPAYITVYSIDFNSQEHSTFSGMKYSQVPGYRIKLEIAVP